MCDRAGGLDAVGVKRVVVAVLDQAAPRLWY